MHSCVCVCSSKVLGIVFPLPLGVVCMCSSDVLGPFVPVSLGVGVCVHVLNAGMNMLVHMH